MAPGGVWWIGLMAFAGELHMLLASDGGSKVSMNHSLPSSKSLPRGGRGHWEMF